MTRILLADDQELIREGFRMILGRAGMEVVGEAGTGAEAVALARDLQPDVVLMDVRMPFLDGIEATRRIAAEAPEVKVIVLTTFDLDEYVFDGLRAGAAGFLLKSSPREDLLRAIDVVRRGDAVVDPSVTRRLVETYGSVAVPDAAPPEELDGLTPREREVFEAMIAGATNAEIAEELYIGEATVKTHVANVLMKLGVRDRVHAVIWAYEHGAVR
ncbi:MAG: response regulator transcription factor [Acidimicrobiia bacterium]|nr:response regulator transcription factor [Acidimicrobiia bacterium]